MVIIRWAVTAAIALLAVVATAGTAGADTATPTLTLSIDAGMPGTPVVITGAGFPAGEIVALYIDAPNPYFSNTPPGPRADSQGAFRESIKWPGNSYDRTHKIDPSRIGPHSVCGDTGYPGNSQPIAVKACAQFVVLVPPTSSSTPSPNTQGAETGIPLPIAGAVLVILLALGLTVWFSTRNPK